MRSRCALAAALLGPLGAACGAASSSPSPSLSGLHVQGAQLVGPSGAAVQLRGVDRAGTEFACVQGNGIFDGPSDSASIAAIRSWHAGAVRLPLNEDCWLGINGVRDGYGGNTYRAAIEDFVSRLHQAGLAVILDLHWSAPGNTPATQQMPMPDADHAPAFWASVAAAFRSDHDVAFDLFNEPFPDHGGAASGDAWDCWLHGCEMHAGYGAEALWRATGMQSLVDAVRSAGATQPLMLAGVDDANDVRGWLAHRPDDPLQQLVASFHVYNFNRCNTPGCWSSEVAPVAARVPVVTGEVGENDCAGGFVDSYLPWADAHGVSYLAWTWNTWSCSSGPALITTYSGTPTAFGAAYRAHLTRM